MSFRPDDWTRLREVFDGARALPPDARPAFLTGACRGDQTLRLEVEQLLASDAGAAGFLETPAMLADDPATVTPLEGQRLGAYRIERRLGEGGMGVVYRALDTKLNRPVAIKFLFEELADASARRALSARGADGFFAQPSAHSHGSRRRVSLKAASTWSPSSSTAAR